MGHILKSWLTNEDGTTRTDQCVSNFKLYGTVETELFGCGFGSEFEDFYWNWFLHKIFEFSKMNISIRWIDDKINWWQDDLVTKCDEIICLLWSVWGIKFKSSDLSVTLISNLVAPILQLFDLDSWLNCNPRTKDYFK